MTTPAITAEHITKVYTLGERARYRNLRDELLRKPAEERNVKTIHALDDVSFEVGQGEAVGLIGSNGSGKSTLLKVLSRITVPNSGHADIWGRVASLLEVGTGFHPELTGRENVFLNGAILGMTKGEILAKYDEIIAFSGLERFVDTPVKRYSSGMYVRLAFSVAAHLEPEILLVDEVLAVGDIGFQRKCSGKMKDVADSGRTIIFVSHNLGAISSLCTRTMWIDKGKLVTFGSTDEVVAEYMKSFENRGSTLLQGVKADDEKVFQVLQCSLYDHQQRPADVFDCDNPFTISLRCRVGRPLQGLLGHLEITDQHGTLVLVSDSYDHEEHVMDVVDQGSYHLQVHVPERHLAPGRYHVHFSFRAPLRGAGAEIDSPGMVGSFELHDYTTRKGNSRRGYFSTKLKWEFDPQPENRTES